MRRDARKRDLRLRTTQAGIENQECIANLEQIQLGVRPLPGIGVGVA
jgi:hypothetical protein